ncbi:hypothetical protein [Pseudoxanthomonas koreensis]
MGMPTGTVVVPGVGMAVIGVMVVVFHAAHYRPDRRRRLLQPRPGP